MKSTYWFGHDANARRDPCNLKMRSVYGDRGYGWYWVLLEMMWESEDNTIRISGKYGYSALMSEMEATEEELRAFVKDCVEEFHLFKSEGGAIWSPYIIERVELMRRKSTKSRDAANWRWQLQKSREESRGVEGDAPALQTQSEGHADAMQGKDSENKVHQNQNRTEEIITVDEIKTDNTSAGEGPDPLPVTGTARVDDMRADSFTGNPKEIYYRYGGIIITRAQKAELRKEYDLTEDQLSNLLVGMEFEIIARKEIAHCRAFVEHYLREAIMEGQILRDQDLQRQPWNVASDPTIPSFGE